MPRDGATNQYSIPVGSDGAPNTTISSTKYNGFIHDVEADLNAPRPVVAGGTAGTSASTARANLKAEVSMQVVTNFDAQVWEAGSFTAAAGATAAPTANAQAGAALVIDSNNIVLRSTDITTGISYGRSKVAGSWGAWSVFGGSDKVAKAGDTMTGDLTISKATPSIILNKPAAGTAARIFGQTNGVNRWAATFGGSAAESGSNAGSDFNIFPYDDAGAQLSTAISIARSTQRVTLKEDPQAALEAATKQYVDTRVRYDAAQGLTAAQQLQARANVYAAPLDALAYNGLQINPQFAVMQDQSSLSGSGTVYIGDVWKSICIGTGKTFASARQDGSPGGPFMAHYLSVSISAGAGGAIGATDQGRVAQFIPTDLMRRLNWGTANAQPLTISFWYGGSVGGTLCVAVTNTPAATRSYVAPVTVTGGGGWGYYTVTIPGDTTGTWFGTEFGTGAVVSLTWLCGSSFQSPTPSAWVAGNYQSLASQSDLLPANGNSLGFSSIMFHPGNDAPSSLRQPLLMRPHADELRYVMRQFWRRVFDLNQYVATLQATSATAAAGMLFPFEVTMRSTPTLTASSPGHFVGQVAGGGGSAFSAMTFNQSTDMAKLQSGTTAGLVAGNAVSVYSNTNGAYIQGDARS